MDIDPAGRFGLHYSSLTWEDVSLAGEIKMTCFWQTTERMRPSDLSDLFTQ